MWFSTMCLLLWNFTKLENHILPFWSAFTMKLVLCSIVWDRSWSLYAENTVATLSSKIGMFLFSSLVTFLTEYLPDLHRRRRQLLVSWRVTIKSDTIRKQSSQIHGVRSCTWGLYPVEYTGVTIKYAFYGSCLRRKDQGLMEPKLTGIEEPQVDRLLWFSIVWLE